MGNLEKFKNLISTSYILKEKGIDQEPTIHLLVSEYANGFALSSSPEFEPDEFKYLMDSVSQMVLDTYPYKKVNSDITNTKKMDYVETIEKHYLKPKTEFESPINQQFGNILIESVFINEKPSYFKFLASFYSDRMYTPALPFSELFNKIFSN